MVQKWPFSLFLVPFLVLGTHQSDINKTYSTLWTDQDDQLSYFLIFLNASGGPVALIY